MEDKQYSRICGRRRSLVRYLASIILPLRPAPRIFFHSVKNPCFFHGCKTEIQYCGMESQAQAPQPVTEFLNPGIGVKPDLLEFESAHNYNEERKSDVSQKLNSLERELNDLRQQMTRIMAAQCNIDSNLERRESMSSPGFSKSSVPPPPPPPPPMPSFNVSVPNIVIHHSAKPIHTSTPKRTAAMFDMASVLKDLGKVKLRPTERSPGGTPRRQPPPPTDSNTLLLLALKKRYEVMHDSPNQDQCNDSDSSFSQESASRSPLIKC